MCIFEFASSGFKIPYYKKTHINLLLHNKKTYIKKTSQKLKIRLLPPPRVCFWGKKNPRRRILDLPDSQPKKIHFPSHGPRGTPFPIIGCLGYSSPWSYHDQGCWACLGCSQTYFSGLWARSYSWHYSYRCRKTSPQWASFRRYFWWCNQS